MHRPARVCQAEREQVALHPLPGQIDPHLPEIDLGVRALDVVPGHKALGLNPALLGDRPTEGGDEVAHRAVRKRDPELLLQPRTDPLGGVSCSRGASRSARRHSSTVFLYGCMRGEIRAGC